MEDIIVKSKLTKKILFLFSSLIFFALGFFEIGLAFGKYDIRVNYNFKGIFNLVIGIITIIFFALIFYYSVKSLKDNIALKVTKEGIFENSSSIKWGLIEWKDIESIKIRYYLNETFIEIRVKDIEKYMDRLSFLSKLFQKGNNKLGFQICIVTSTLNYNVDVLCTLLQEYHEYILNKENL